MSALFFKKDYFKRIESLVDTGKFESALNLAIKIGDSLYDKGDLKDALDLYEKLLDLFKRSNFSDNKVFEKLYEKLIPLLFEIGKTEQAIEMSLILVDIKIALEKSEEAKEILYALKREFKDNEKVLLRDVDINLREGRTEDALQTLKYMISHISPDPKYIEIAVEILLKLGRKDEALDYLNTLISIDPGNVFAETKLREIKGESTSVNQNEEPIFNESKIAESKEEQGPRGQKKEVFNGEVNPKVPLSRKTASVKKISVLNKGQKHSFKKETENVEKYNAIYDEFFKKKEYKNAIVKVLDNPKRSFTLLLNLADDCKDRKKFLEAEYYFLKAFLIEPESKLVVEKLANIYEQTGRKEDKVFVLKAAVKYAKGNEKINYLVKISELVPDNYTVKAEIVREACAIGEKEVALKYFNQIKSTDKNLINELFELLFPLVSKDLNVLKNLALKMKSLNMKTKTTFKYYLTVGKLLFNMGDKPEGLKWLMRANEIGKLPLEDYVQIAEYIKDIPLDTEKDIVAAALNGYADVITSDEEKGRILKLILSLKPNNTLYIKKYAEFLKSKGKYKDVAYLIKKLIAKADVNSLDLVGSSPSKIAEYLDDNILIKAAELFIIEGDTVKAGEIYEILQRRNPDNKQYVVKNFILQVENENIESIVKFFENVSPNHNFANFVEQEISKFEKKRTLSPFDYHVHFVLGFLYYLIERYEEAIASFQFVLRSHRFEILMYLFLGMSFEKIGLPDFAIKRYQSALDSNIENDFIRRVIFERIISILTRQGKFDEARRFGEKALRSGVKDEKIVKLVESIPNEDKIIHMKEMKND